ncbi:MAG: hypothetical protein KF780_12315 [Sphingomonas sp.]|nr:hypothetical protein [Sphingomonas sp.]
MTSPRGAPVLVRGHRGIADYLGMTTRQVAHLDRQRKLPLFWKDGAIVATRAALDDWRAIGGEG